MTDKYEGMPDKIWSFKTRKGETVFSSDTRLLGKEGATKYIRADHHQALVQALEGLILLTDTMVDAYDAECCTYELEEARKVLSAAKMVDANAQQGDWK